jgi:hypothetical protein
MNMTLAINPAKIMEALINIAVTDIQTARAVLNGIAQSDNCLQVLRFDRLIYEVARNKDASITRFAHEVLNTEIIPRAQAHPSSGLVSWRDVETFMEGKDEDQRDLAMWVALNLYYEKLSLRFLMLKCRASHQPDILNKSRAILLSRSNDITLDYLLEWGEAAPLYAQSVITELSYLIELNESQRSSLEQARQSSYSGFVRELISSIVKRLDQQKLVQDFFAEHKLTA